MCMGGGGVLQEVVSSETIVTWLYLHMFLEMSEDTESSLAFITLERTFV